MSEAGNQDQSILLPEASVTVFSKDTQVQDVAVALQGDWRFARVSVQVERGDLETAISTYGEFASPDVLVIQTDTIDESFTSRLEALAGNCDEGTSAIIIGPENDVNLYRRLIEMGVSDYLVRPLDHKVFGSALAKTLIEKKGVSGSTLIAVCGAKGGVGASLLSEGLACGIADIAGHKTVLLDAAGGWSTLGVGLGFEPSTTLAEAAKAAESANEDNLKRMMHQVGDNLQVLATGGDVMLDNLVTGAQLEGLIDMLMVKSPVLVADLSHSPEALQKVILARANMILVVATPTLPALRLARSYIGEVSALRGGEDDEALRFVINMQGMSAAHEVSKKDIEGAVGQSVDAFLPFAPKAFMGAESSSKKLTDDKETREFIEKSLLPIVRPVLGNRGADEAGKPEKKGGLMAKLFSGGG